MEHWTGATMRSNVPLFYGLRLSVPLISAVSILDKISSSALRSDNSPRLSTFPVYKAPAEADFISHRGDFFEFRMDRT